MSPYLKIITVLMLALCGCARSPQGGLAPVYLTDTAPFHLLPPTALAQPLAVTGQFSGNYGERQFSCLVWLEMDATKVAMSLMNTAGGGLGDFFYDGKTVSFTSSLLTKKIKPEYIAADLQLIFYRADLLTAELAKIGLRLEIASNDETRRVLTAENAPIIVIEKTASAITFTNNLRGYRYVLQGMKS